jgi:hypothetical protein
MWEAANMQLVFQEIRPVGRPTYLLHRKNASGSWNREVKCTLVQALRLCTGRTVHRGSSGIALLIHDHSTRKG